MASRERLRASDSDRERAVTLLHEAATEGRIDADELDDRLTRAFLAKTYGELDALVEDLPVPVRRPVPAPAPPARAGFWARFGAMFIDGLIVGLVAGLLSTVVHHSLGTVFLLAISAGYFTVLEGGPGGAGIGKRALGLRVVDARTGGAIGYPRAFVRWLTRLLSAAALFIGYLWMLGDSENQCWHDKLAGDVVIRPGRRRELEPRRRLG